MNLCLSLADSSEAVLGQKVARFAGQVPYIEIRLDYLSEVVVPTVPTDLGTEFIATCRPLREGGFYRGEERDRLSILQRAAHSGFAWVDLEYDVQEVPPFPASTRIVRSYHCFDRFPEDLTLRFNSLKKTGGDVIKMALSIKETRQMTSLLQWMESLAPEVPFVVSGMETLGQPSRILGAFLGNFWTYVAEDENSKVAPGQLTLEEAIQCYQLPRWNHCPDIYGVLGNPVAHSLSPLIHNHLFQGHQLDKVYLPFLLDDVQVWLDYVEQSSLPFSGFSVTLPFKSAVTSFVDDKETPVDSLNTLVKTGSVWKGLNTDYPGFLQALQSRLTLKGKTALVLGNGGVAHTVVKALVDQGVKVTVVGRNPDKVSDFAHLYGCGSILFSDLPMSAHICVNTTPVGQFPDIEDSPVPENQMDFEVVYDLVYSPENTRLLELARSQGIEVISGMEMFVEQAALQSELWTGRSPDRDTMMELIRGQL
ncbi:MAG: type I 3-dehydroquinate dehydratase [Acidobacteriota bacterium]